MYSAKAPCKLLAGLVAHARSKAATISIPHKRAQYSDRRSFFIEHSGFVSGCEDVCMD